MTGTNKNDKISVLGVTFDNVTMEQALEKALEMAQNKGCDYIVTPNAEIVYAASKDKEAMTAVNGASMVIPDGVGIIKAGKILKTPLKEKVAGAVLGERLLPLLIENNLSLFIFGGKTLSSDRRNTVAQKAAENLIKKYPGLKIAGTSHGFVKEDAGIIKIIDESNADVLYVCTGAPRQEKWIYKHKSELKCRLAIGLGGSIDIYAGETSKAPKIFVAFGLEWLYRLLKQPSRIKRMPALPGFLLAVYKSRR